MCFASCSEKDKWGLTKNHYFKFSQYETDAVDQVLRGVFGERQGFFSPAVYGRNRRQGCADVVLEGLINGGTPAMYLVRYYPHSHVFINATPVQGKQ